MKPPKNAVRMKKNKYASNIFVTVKEPTIVYKKLQNGRIATLLLPVGTKIYTGSNPSTIPYPYKHFPVLQKMRVNQAKVLVITDKHFKNYTKGLAIFWGAAGFEYKVGKLVKPNGFSKKHEQCGRGIHFFRTKTEARKFNL